MSAQQQKQVLHHNSVQLLRFLARLSQPALRRLLQIEYLVYPVYLFFLPLTFFLPRLLFLLLTFFLLRLLFLLRRELLCEVRPYRLPLLRHASEPILSFRKNICSRNRTTFFRRIRRPISLLRGFRVRRAR